MTTPSSRSLRFGWVNPIPHLELNPEPSMLSSSRSCFWNGFPSQDGNCEAKMEELNLFRGDNAMRLSRA